MTARLQHDEDIKAPLRTAGSYLKVSETNSAFLSSPVLGSSRAHWKAQTLL